jgi:hypothetical protein
MDVSVGVKRTASFRGNENSGLLCAFVYMYCSRLGTLSSINGTTFNSHVSYPTFNRAKHCIIGEKYNGDFLERIYSEE